LNNVKWIKLSTRLFDDEKIQLIENMPEGDAVLVIWIKLLVLAANANGDGTIRLSETIPFTDEMLATIFRKPLATVRLALTTFTGFGMIEIAEDKTIEIVRWGAYQEAIDLARIREQGRKRTQKCREKKTLPSSSKEEEEGEGEGESNITVALHSDRHHRGAKVLLLDSEYGSLCSRYTQEVADQYIEKINDYCVSHGKHYANYNQTVHNWIKRDKEQGQFREPAKKHNQVKPTICPECGGELAGKLCINRDCPSHEWNQ